VLIVIAGKSNQGRQSNQKRQKP